MTEWELLLEEIRALNQYLSMLTNDKWSDDEIGLPKSVSRMEEVDRVLDLILEYRRKLKKCLNCILKSQQMKKQTDKPAALRNSVEGFFNTVDDLLEKGKFTPADQDWLEKELAEMEQKLRAYKQGKVEKAAVA